MSLANLVTHHEYVRLELVKQLLATYNGNPALIDTTEVIKNADKLKEYVDEGISVLFTQKTDNP